MKKIFFVAFLSFLTIGSVYAAKPKLKVLIADTPGETLAAIGNDGSNMGWTDPSTYGLSSSDHNSFAVDYGDAGVLKGHGRCSTRVGATDEPDFVDDLTDETGQDGAEYCYCQLDSYTASGDSAQELSGPWAFMQHIDPGMCGYYCSSTCAGGFYDTYNILFRETVFGAYPTYEPGDPIIVATQSYADNSLNGKQPIITTTGTNKLMTYGSSAGAVGEREIVSSLGTSTTATTIPNTYSIITGINSKQGAFNSPADIVVTGTGSAGVVGERPVYSSTNNFDKALITVQTINTTATNAANGKITCVDNDCLLMQINMSAPTGLSTRLYLDPSIAGTDTCYRSINGGSSYDKNGTCSASTLSYIGATGSKSGKWGVVFPYGDVTGISVCSSITGSSGAIATSSQTSTLNTQFNAQTGGGSPAGKYLWCKMTSPATSQWVYLTAIGTTNGCGQLGAQNCAMAIQSSASGRNTSTDRINLHRNVYGSVQ